MINSITICGFVVFFCFRLDEERLFFKTKEKSSMKERVINEMQLS